MWTELLSPLLAWLVVWMYSDRCIFGPPLQPEVFDLKLEVVLKCRDIYIEYIIMVSMTAALKMEGMIMLNGGVLNSRDRCILIRVIAVC